MSEDDAQQWIIDRFGEKVLSRLAQFVEILVQNTTKQNLIAPSTMMSVWARHIVDSAQLAPLAKNADDGPWIDIGTGAGFPGVVAAIVQHRAVTFVEPRTKRAEFLKEVIKALSLNASVSCSTIQAVRGRAGILSARAVAAVPLLLERAVHCSDGRTLWILPKGRKAGEEIASAQRSWHGMFHVEHSVTDPQSLIVLASGISRR